MTEETGKPGKPKGPHKLRRLSAVQIKSLGPGRHADGHGLALLVAPGGGRRWIQRLRIRGRRSDIGHGSADLVTLADARRAAEEFRRIARAGGDPLAERRKAAAVPTFREAARACHRAMSSGWKSEKHGRQWLQTLEDHAFGVLGPLRVDGITTADVVRTLLPIWHDVPETARRVRQRIGAVMDWSIAHGHRGTASPMVGIAKALPRRQDQVTHHRALPHAGVGAFMRTLGDDTVGLAMRLLILCASRSGEVRLASAAEFDLDSKLWVIPGRRMKSGKEHVVPLSSAAVEVVRKALEIRTGKSGLLFEGRTGKALTDMSLLMRLKRAGVPAVPHGFRSSFRDWCSELTSVPREVAEAALSHAVRDQTEAAYRRTALVERRRALMEDWASYLEREPGGNVVALVPTTRAEAS